ncbi:MAG: lipopolysaccharide biosynthesis protein RfbH [Chloroflexi bacterium]|nr:lipopolysaccharide biosynthesis protein RfbH [Chloroflexota bacterium]
MSDDLENLRQEIFAKVTEYYEKAHADQPFVPGETRVQYAGRVYDEREMVHMVDAVLEFWLTAGRHAEEFERRLGKFIGAREVIPVNSGSSANLVAMTTLCSPQLKQRLLPGDEVITPAVTFPTTLAPIVQNRLIPVLVDAEMGTYNIDLEQLEAAMSPRTRALFITHTLGNPIAMDRVVEFARARNLFIIEDTCDALGSKYNGQSVGTFGHVATLSFYPAHHITMGEGGAVYTHSRRLAKIARTVRDWGRDCFCGYDNPVNGKCGIRFEREIPGIEGYYDHRYYFTEIGYNLKLTDVQAAMGVAQMDKLPGFVAARKRNFARLYAGLKKFEEFLILPTWLPNADPSWFALPLTVRDTAPFDRTALTRYLENHKVETRMIFAGNILKQPGYKNIERRVVGSLPVADQVMRSSFFIGVYPGLTDAKIDYMLEMFAQFMAEHGGQ